MSSENPSGGDDQQETHGPFRGDPQRLYARHARPLRGGVMRQSELHGDMQSQAETTWPLGDEQATSLFSTSSNKTA
jgi:hypothetical protein